MVGKVKLELEEWERLGSLAPVKRKWYSVLRCPRCNKPLLDGDDAKWDVGPRVGIFPLPGKHHHYITLSCTCGYLWEDEGWEINSYSPLLLIFSVVMTIVGILIVTILHGVSNWWAILPFIYSIYLFIALESLWGQRRYLGGKG